MIVTQNRMPVDKFGSVTASKEFTIKATSKAFGVLASKLYKNKIAAAIRELSTNAYDSHVSVGKRDVPFEIHLPSFFEPYFSVRDYGSGISNEDMEAVFTTFFESTKEKSNDYIGTMGLGCKAPFSYVDSFIVYTYTGAVCETYECFLENGAPRLSHKATVPSNQEVGVEIQFAVLESDFHTFAREAANIYQWFNVHPVVSGNTIAINPLPKLQGSCWAVGDSLTAVMGQVRYPIAADIVKTDLKNLTVFFDIGEVDVQAGREELSYDKETIAAVQARLNTVSREIDALYADILKDATNIFEANSIVGKYDNRLVSIRAPMWQGQKVSGSVSSVLSSMFQPVSSYGQTWNTLKKEAVSVNDMTMLVMNSDKTSPKRLNIWKAANPKACGYVLGVKPLPVGNNGNDPEKIREMFGSIPVVFSSEIPMPSSRAKLRALTPWNVSYDLKDKGEHEFDTDAGGIYIPARNLKAIHPLDPEETIAEDDVRAIQRLLFAHLTKEAVAIVPWSRRKEFGEDWINCFTPLAAKFAELKSKPGFDTEFRLARNYGYFIQGGGTGTIVLSAVERLYNTLPDCGVKDFLDYHKKCIIAHAKWGDWCRYYDVVTAKPTKPDKLRKMWVDIIANYPLFATYYGKMRYEPINNIVMADICLYLDHKTKSMNISNGGN